MEEIKSIISKQMQQLQTLMHRVMFSRHAKAHNPLRGQGRVLSLIKLKPVISQKELTYLLDMSKQSVAELLAKLEKSEFITREPSEEDKRVMTIKLTELGAKASEEADDNEPDLMEILDCLNNDELASFSNYLSRIIAKCEELNPDEDFEAHRRYVEKFMSAHGHGGHGMHGECHGHGAHGEGHGHGMHGEGHGHGAHGEGHGHCAHGEGRGHGAHGEGHGHGTHGEDHGHGAHGEGRGHGAHGEGHGHGMHGEGHGHGAHGEGRSHGAHGAHGEGHGHGAHGSRTRES